MSMWELFVFKEKKNPREAVLKSVPLSEFQK